ncbi:MAG TPA: hypothetical protein VKV22_12270 [Rhodanobacteraceae bacterium]|nr:hypothetical protein [Rhodanobacteraceae bacterium]
MSPSTHANTPDANCPANPDRRQAQAAERESAKEECERLLDKELIETFPASDPPSWTMGGSHVSTLRH